MLAKVRETLEAYCESSGRPLDVVKRWFRKLPHDKQDKALRNIEVVGARRELGIVGEDAKAPPRIILP